MPLHTALAIRVIVRKKSNKTFLFIVPKLSIYLSPVYEHLVSNSCSQMKKYSQWTPSSSIITEILNNTCTLVAPVELLWLEVPGDLEAYLKKLVIVFQFIGYKYLIGWPLILICTENLEFENSSKSQTKSTNLSIDGGPLLRFCNQCKAKKL